MNLFDLNLSYCKTIVTPPPPPPPSRFCTVSSRVRASTCTSYTICLLAGRSGLRGVLQQSLILVVLIILKLLFY